MCEVIGDEHETLVYETIAAAASIVCADRVYCHLLVVPMSRLNFVLILAGEIDHHDESILQQFFKKLVNVSFSSLHDFPRHFFASRCSLLGVNQSNLLGGSTFQHINKL